MARSLSGILASPTAPNRLYPAFNTSKVERQVAERTVRLRKDIQMSEKEGLGELNSQVDSLRQVAIALHDLCQPLTTLQCRLEMAGGIDTPEAYREAVEVGLTECARLAEAVGSMRVIMRTAARDAAAEAHAASQGLH
jgi:signal transduction histidine kinase